jgi:hypothetical protein
VSQGSCYVESCCSRYGLQIGAWSLKVVVVLVLVFVFVFAWTLVTSLLMRVRCPRHPSARWRGRRVLRGNTWVWRRRCRVQGRWTPVRLPERAVPSEQRPELARCGVRRSRHASGTALRLRRAARFPTGLPPPSCAQRRVGPELATRRETGPTAR